ALPPGGTYWRTNSVRVPVTKDGSYYLFFQANGDLYRPLYESDFSNNLAVAQVNFHILPPDLAPFFFQGPTNLNGPQLQVVNLVWGVTNQGPGSALGSPYSWTDWILLSKTNPTDGSQIPLNGWSFNVTNTLAPGQVYWSTNSINLPIVESGVYQLTLTTAP